MGARLVVRFGDDTDSDPAPRVYLHNGGEYVEDIRDTLDEFLAAVDKLEDKRLDDPGYLAAKLIVWAAMQQVAGFEWNARTGDVPSAALAFLSVGVVTSDGWGDGVAVMGNDGTYRIEQALDVDEVVSG